jgi:hypothetical protein
VFINAAVAFMNSEPDFKGEALLLAHVINDELFRHCEDLIPRHLKRRIRFLPDLADRLREKLIAASVAIFPSAYESFCLAAYEASKLGALVLLNRSNPAFGSNTPWQDDVNCKCFDGTTQGLVGVLRDIWRRRQSLRHEAVIVAPPAVPYWLRGVAVAPASPLTAGRRAGLSVIVAVSDQFGDPSTTVRSALLADGVNVDVILACDLPPSAPARAAVLSRIRGSGLASEGSVRIVELGFRGGLAALCNLGLREAANDMVAFARAGIAIDPTFFVDAVRALEVEPDYDFVIPQLAFEALPSGHPTPVADKVRIGEALNAGLVHNLLGGIEVVARRSAASSIGFDETLDRYVDWDFHLRACAAGHRYIVSNRIDIRLEVSADEAPEYFRSHFDSVLVKHGANFAGGRVPLVAAFDARTIADTAAASPLEDGPTANLLFAKRPLKYYLWEKRPWWRVAWKHPTKPLRWLMLREIQSRRARKR